jgi:hypothetical protein
MRLTPVTQIDQIKEGDALVINDGHSLISAKAEIVKVSEQDGTEVIFKVKENAFFNVGMFLDGEILGERTRRGKRITEGYTDWDKTKVGFIPVKSAV